MKHDACAAEMNVRYRLSPLVDCLVTKSSWLPEHAYQYAKRLAHSLTPKGARIPPNSVSLTPSQRRRPITPDSSRRPSPSIRERADHLFLASFARLPDPRVRRFGKGNSCTLLWSVSRPGRPSASQPVS